MADPTQTPAADTQPDPSAVESDSTQSQGQGAYCIEIHVAADGSLSVSVEPEDQEYDEDQGIEDKGTPARDIKDALTKALEIYKADGQMPMSEDDADFDAGFKSRSGAY